MKLERIISETAEAEWTHTGGSRAELFLLDYHAYVWTDHAAIGNWVRAAVSFGAEDIARLNVKNGDIRTVREFIERVIAEHHHKQQEQS